MQTLEIQRRSGTMQGYVTALWVLSLTLVVLERFSAATIEVFQSGFAAPALRALACQLAAALPEGLFLVGLWWVREALAAIARGELFASPVTRMLDRVGTVLACGSAARVAVVPAVCSLLGEGAGYWIAFDASALVLAAIGLALKAIAGLLRHASDMQSELDGIF